MENILAKAMAEKATEKLTENGDKAYSTTSSSCLDFFVLAGSYRTRTEQEIMELWENAVSEDKIKAYILLFMIRSIRHGQGERRLFRVIWDSLPDSDKEKLYPLVPEVGRYDDLENTIYSDKVIAEKIRETLDSEYELLNDGQLPSLLTKWLPCGRGNKSVKERTRKMAKALGYSEQEYRKRVVAIRKKLNLVESKMARNEWSEIDYSKLPSLAGHKYSKAFHKHDSTRYSSYIQEAISGTAKMNAGVLTPSEVLFKAVRYGASKEEAQVAEAEWRSLPDFLGKGNSGLAMVDTSGSMGCTISNKGLMTASIASSAMGIYLAERNKGPFKDLILTFSSNPSFINIKGLDTLDKKFRKIQKGEWGGSTNIDKAFKAILNLAIENNCSQEELPKTLYVFSDMEFDYCVRGGDTSAFERAKRAYEKNGYILPNVVFWNLCARNDTLPVKKNEQGVALVSGYSTRIFTMIASGILNPEEVMNQAIEDFPYSKDIKEIMISSKESRV